MRDKPFTRPTIIAANEFVAAEALTHTQINKIVLRPRARSDVPGTMKVSAIFVRLPWVGVSNWVVLQRLVDRLGMYLAHDPLLMAFEVPENQAFDGTLIIAQSRAPHGWFLAEEASCKNVPVWFGSGFGI